MLELVRDRFLLVRRRILTGLLVLALPAALAVGGLGAGTANASVKSNARSAAGTTLTLLGEDTDWVNFDFQVDEVNQDTDYLPAAYDRLVAFGPKGSVVPYVASSWKVTPASRPTSATFSIRHGVTCSDGAELTPRAIAASFERLFTVTKTVNLTSTNLGPGPFSVSYNEKKWTVTIKTGTPFSGLLSGFAWPGASIICPAGLKALKTNPNALQTAMYGSGPYTLVSSTHADRIVFKRRPNWSWGPNTGSTGSQLPGTLIYDYVADPTTIANLLLTGGLDVAVDRAPDPRLASDHSLIKQTLPLWSAAQIAFNMGPGHATDDKAVREALTYAINPATYNKIATEGGEPGVLTPSIVVPGEACYDAAVAKLVPKPNMAKAASLLASDGYTLSGGKLMKNGQQLTLHLTGLNFTSAAAGDYVVAQLSALGIAVNMDSPTQYSADVVDGDWDVAALSDSGNGVPDPTRDLPVFSGSPPPNGLNFGDTGAGNTQLNTLVKDAEEYSGAKQCQYLDQLQELFVKNYWTEGISSNTELEYSNGWTILPGQNYEVYSLKKVS